jgi:hypothetical protein
VDLTGLLLRAGATRPHVLIAAVPGGTQVRLAAEEQLRRRGWPSALTPANADLLLVAGTPARDIADALEATWAAIPAPRARVHAASPGEVAATLDAARAELASEARQRHAAAAGAGQPAGHYDRPAGRAMPGHGEHGMAGGGHDTGHGHDAVGDGAHDPGDGGDSGHGMGEMEMPAGLPMADRGEDRDGLKLDQLHVPLGPVLPDWPAGLVVRVTLQGDVVQHAEVDAVGLGGDGGSFWAEPWRLAAVGEPVPVAAAARRHAAAHLDSLGRFLAVAGWDDAAANARALRDDTLRGVPGSSPGAAVRRLARRVSRSRVLAWSTQGMGILRPGEFAGGAVSDAAGDVTARYRRWCSSLTDASWLFDDGTPLDAIALSTPHGEMSGLRARCEVLLAVLPRLLEGTEFAAARLIVASLDPDLSELSASAEASRGQ